MRTALRRCAKGRGRFVLNAAVALAILEALPTALRAQNTVYFSTSDPGVTKSVAEWGVDSAWPSYDNVRQSVLFMGQGNVDVVRMTFHPGQALVANPDGSYSLNATAKGYADAQLSLASLAGSKPITLVPGDFGPTFDQVNWVRTIKATQEYINSKPGFSTTRINAIEAFNEPDYWAGEGTPSQLNSVIQQLKAYSEFQNTQMLAGSTLNSDWAQHWFDQAPAATTGSSHLLGGSLTSYVNFIEYVKNTGKTFANPELHSLGEAIVGAEHGMVSCTWWADVLKARGLFVQASDGKRLGYYEDLGRQSAAAVYRAPNGKIHAFAGGLERFGSRTAYRFVCTDKDVFFNGIPVREYMLQTKSDDNVSATDNDYQNYGSWSNQGAYADVETSPGMPALDGYRWKIVNRQTGQAMEVVSGGTADGSLIRSATDSGAVYQKWNIVRTRNGYFQLYNANSGRTAEVANGSLDNFASVRQWGTADNQIQQWQVESAGNGYFYIRNGFSNKCLTSSSSNSYQYDQNGTAIQQWRFVLANPTTPAKLQYQFYGNVNDSAGSFHGTASGNPTYGLGQSGQAINLDGVDDYVTLPSGVASSTDITISANVKWNGGNAWQRIFDFGNDTTSYLFLTPKSAGNTMRFAISKGSSGAEEILETDPLPTGQWVHLALTLGGNTGVLYLNGKPKVAGEILWNPSDIAPALNYIGKSQWNDPLFNGSIANFRIYDYALHMSQVAGLVYRRWTGALNSNWTTTAQSYPKNWEFDVAAADYVNGNAILFDDWASNFTVNISDATVSPSSVMFDNSISDYTLNRPGAIAGSATLTKNGMAALTICSANTYTGGTVVNAGTLTLRNPNAIGTGALSISNSRVKVSTGSSAARVSRVAISGNAIIDLVDSSLVITDPLATPFSATLAQVISGYNAGLWNGASGIVSSVANSGSIGIACATSADISAYATSFRGQAYSGPVTLLAVTYYGDANLDGIVNSLDFNSVFGSQANFGLASGGTWVRGDFNYDGRVNTLDFNALAGNFGKTFVPASSEAVLGAIVPEPTCLAAAGIALLTVSRKRHRR